MKLYEEIILLKEWFTGKWVVENVIPYYKPLIEGKILGRHTFWSNFCIPTFHPEKNKPSLEMSSAGTLQQFFGFNLKGYELSNKRQSLRNCVHPEIGEHVLNCAIRAIENLNVEQAEIFKL